MARKKPAMLEAEIRTRLAQAGADKECIRLVTGWGRDKAYDETLRACLTHRLGTVIEKIKALAAARSFNERKASEQIEILKNLLSPQGTDFVDAVFAPSTKRPL